MKSLLFVIKMKMEIFVKMICFENTKEYYCFSLFSNLDTMRERLLKGI